MTAIEPGSIVIPSTRSSLTYLVVAMHQDNSQIGGFEFASVLHGYIIPLTDVVDVNGDTSIST